MKMTKIALRRVLSRSDIFQRALIFGFAVMFAVGLATAFESLSLSTTQIQFRDFGTFQTRTIGAATADSSNWNRDRIEEARSDIGSAQVAFAEPGIRVGDGLRTDFYYIETEWPSESLGGITLIEGRWPTAPLEVVIVSHGGFTAMVGDTVELYSGRSSLTVVGLVTDDFAEQPKLLGSIGTLSVIAEETRGFRQNGAATLSPLLIVHWDTGDQSQDQVESAIARSPISAGSVITESRSSQTAGTGWAAKLPAAFAGPAVLILAASLAGSIWLINQRLARFTLVTRGLGASRTSTALFAASVAAVSLGSVAVTGGTLGFGLAVLARPSIRTFSGDPVGDIEVPWLALLLVLSAVLIGIAASGRIAISDDEEAPTEKVNATVKDADSRIAGLRRVVAATAAGAAIVLAARYSLVRSMIAQICFATAGLLMIPDMVRLLPKKSTDPLRRFVYRRLWADRKRIGASVVALASLLTFPLTWEVFLSSALSYRLGQNDTHLRFDELAVADEVTTVGGPRPIIVDIADRVLGDQITRVGIGFLGTAEETVVQPFSNQLVAVVDSVSEAEAVLDININTETAEAMETGSVLTWRHPAFGDPPLTGNETKFIQNNRSGDTKELGSFPIVWVDENDNEFEAGSEFARIHYGIILKPANLFDVQVSPERVLYLGVSQSQADRIVDSVRQSGYPVESIQRFEAATVAPPAAWTMALAALIFVMTIATFTFVRSSVRNSRRQIEALVGLGVSVRQSQMVGAALIGIPLGVAFAVAVALSTLPALITFGGSSGIPLDLAPVRVGTICVTYLVTAGAGIAIGISRLQPSTTKRN